jgi:uncharacterized lipoprotein YajG
MNTNKKILFLLAGAILLTSCATSKKEEIQAGGSNTSKAVCSGLIKIDTRIG